MAIEVSQSTDIAVVVTVEEGEVTIENSRTKLPSQVKMKQGSESGSGPTLSLGWLSLVTLNFH